MRRFLNSAAIRGIAKLTLPIWARMLKTSTHKPLSQRSGGITVSLTTIPSRIDKLWIVLESIFRQTILPDKIVLTLSEPEFPNGENDFPASLKKYIKLGVEVVFIPDDLKSYKKYYYSISTYADSRIITIDDDCWYRNDTIERLICLGDKYPDCVIANMVRVIRQELNYGEWKKVRKPMAPSHSNLAIGIGGVLYPRNFNQKCMQQGYDIRDKNTFMDLAPFADDLWLKANEIASGIKVAGTGMRYTYITIIGTQKLALRKANLGPIDRNTTQWNNLKSRLFSAQNHTSLVSGKE